MKINWNKKYTTIALYACAVTAFTVACIFIGINIGSVWVYINKFLQLLNPLIIGFIIAYLFNPLMRFCERNVFKFCERKRPHPTLKRVLSLIATYLFFTMILAVIISLIIPQIILSYNDLIFKMSDYTKSIQAWVENIVETLPFLDMDKIMDSINNIIQDSYAIIQQLTPYVTGFLSTTLNILKNAFLGIILSVYFLFSKERLTALLKKILFAFTTKKHGDTFLGFLSFTDKTFGGFIMGKLVDSAIIGLLTFIILAIFKMPYYQLISVIVGVTNIIPFFGPFIGAIPSLFIIFIADPSKALWFLVIIIIIQQLDGNIIGPKILGQSTGLSSLGVIVAITVMSGLLGIAGMFIGVPLFALLNIMFQRFVQNRLDKIRLKTERGEEK